MPHVKSSAIVLNCYDYSESSQIAHLLTRDRGKVRVIAKGIKKNRSFGVFDLFVHCDVVYLQKKKSSDDLAILVELAIHTNFHGIRARLERIYAALFALELVNASAQEANPEPEVFDLLLRFLTLLEALEPERVRPALLLFEVHFLRLSGFLPRFSRCLRCQRPVSECPGSARFLAGAGGFCCSRCTPGTESGPRVSTRALAVLARLDTTSSGGGGLGSVPRDVLGDLDRILISALESMLERRLKLTDFLKRLDGRCDTARGGWSRDSPS